jgi:RNA polymerase sigma-70 factor (ECF subfamily)
MAAARDYVTWRQRQPFEDRHNRMSTLGETRYSLLLRLHDASNDEAWREFVELYERALFRYVRSKGLQDADAIEVVQQVLIAVHRSVEGWSSNGAGSFRAWLLRVASNMATTVVRKRYRQRMLTGGTTVNKLLEAAPSTAHRDATDEEERQWRQWAFCWASSRVQHEVADKTWQAFWRTAVENEPPADVATKLGLSIGSVYAAKCRVMQRLRDAASEIDSSEVHDDQM